MSRDGTDVDMGNFKREAWATQAFTLGQGKMHVDFAVIEANLQGRAKNRTRTMGKASKVGGSQINFMVEFECPRALSSDRQQKQKRSQVPPFRVALRYVPLPAGVTEFNYYHKLMEYFLKILGRSEFVSANSGGSWRRALSSTSEATSTEFYYDPRVNHPFCTLNEVADKLTGFYCETIGAFELFIDLMDLGCKGAYPNSMLPRITQSQNLKTDKEGSAIPVTFFKNYLENGGSLPYNIEQSVLDNERATLFWLFDKTQQLGPWQACDSDDGRVGYPFADQLAPGFGPATFYNITNEFERAPIPDLIRGPSNFSNTVLAVSALSDDGNTFLLVVRGTRARSEWITDFTWNQVNIDAVKATINEYLSPFVDTAVHAGFLDLFEKIYPDIYNEYLYFYDYYVNNGFMPPQIVVAGHSLGAGMTQLLALALATDFGVRVDAAMFAPPAAGDLRFATKFNKLVNGRRLAYVSDEPELILDLETLPTLRVGDVVPQAPCPVQKTCAFTDIVNGLPVNTFNVLDGTPPILNYQAVNGNILFDYRDLPSPPAEWNLGYDFYQVWIDNDTLAGGGYSHICTYACFLSSAVNVDITGCMIPDHLAIAGNNIPPNVQAYGVCRP